MIKPFSIQKLVTSTNNKTATNILKGIIWIAKVIFCSLDKTWQYMLAIPSLAHQSEVTKDVVY